MKKSALIIEDHPIYRDALVVFMRALLGESKVVAVSSTEEGLGCAGNIDYLVWSLPGCIAKGVSKYQPSFSVGIVYLDCFAVHGNQDITRVKG